MRAHLTAAHPFWEVVEGLGGDPWCKAAAVEDGLSRASGDVLVVHDADVICPGLGEAVGRLDGGAAWVMPHLVVHRFSEAGTQAIYDGADPATVADYDQAPYHGWPGGGIVVLRRADYERAPLDHRMTGWGQEDISWSYCLDTIIGDHARLGWPLWHCWHPSQPRLTRRVGSRAGEALWQRYRAARGRPALMAGIVAEGRP